MNSIENNDRQDLIQLYDIIQKKEEFYHQRADDDPQHVISFLVAIIVALIGVEYFNNSSVLSSNIYILYFLLPVLTSYGIARQCFYSRFVAILRGYSKYLEEQLNSLFPCNLFFWDRSYFDELISPPKFRTYYASTAAFIIGFALPNIYAFYTQWENYGNSSCKTRIIFGIIWGTCILIILIATWDILNVEKIRIKAYEYAKSHGLRQISKIHTLPRK